MLHLVTCFVITTFDITYSWCDELKIFYWFHMYSYDIEMRTPNIWHGYIRGKYTELLIRWLHLVMWNYYTYRNNCENLVNILIVRAVIHLTTFSTRHKVFRCLNLTSVPSRNDQSLLRPKWFTPLLSQHQRRVDTNEYAIGEDRFCIHLWLTVLMWYLQWRYPCRALWQRHQASSVFHNHINTTFC